MRFHKCIERSKCQLSHTSELDFSITLAAAIAVPFLVGRSRPCCVTDCCTSEKYGFRGRNRFGLENEKERLNQDAKTSFHHEGSTHLNQQSWLVLPRKYLCGSNLFVDLTIVASFDAMSTPDVTGASDSVQRSCSHGCCLFSL